MKHVVTLVWSAAAVVLALWAVEGIMEHDWTRETGHQWVGPKFFWRSLDTYLDSPYYDPKKIPRDST